MHTNEISQARQVEQSQSTAHCQHANSIKNTQPHGISQRSLKLPEVQIWNTAGLCIKNFYPKMIKLSHSTFRNYGNMYLKSLFPNVSTISYCNDYQAPRTHEDPRSATPNPLWRRVDVNLCPSAHCNSSQQAGFRLPPLYSMWRIRH